MADENEAEEPAAKSSGGMMLTLIIAILAIGGGVVTPLVISRLSATEDDDTKPKKQVVAIPEIEEEVDFIEFDEVTVNLDEARFSKFLRLNFSLKVGKSQMAEVEDKVTRQKSIVKNWIQIHLAEKSTDDLRGKFGRNQVRRELLDFLNKQLFDDGIERVQDVLFNEFYVQ